MKNLKIVFAVMAAVVLMASSGDSPQDKYIARYSGIAVREMYRSGVPASITLAQGLLESRYGASPLATKGNNHFGIKCHDWKGKHMSYDDDKKGECFRVYDTAEESFRDHSDFLRYRDRYKFLFENKTTDYKSWAYGLKKAGYATDPSYPAKLIKLIEDYNLSRFDRMTKEDVLVEAEASEAVSEDKEQEGQEEIQLPVSDRKDRVYRRRKHGKPVKKTVREEIEEEFEGLTDRIPDSPLSIEEPKPVRAEEFRFSMTRQMYSRNGVPFLSSSEGETYSSIAKNYKLFLKELLRFNDLSSEEELAPGTIVYLQAKKSKAAKGLDKYIVDSDDEDLREICQRFGVRMSSIIKLNGFPEGYRPLEGDTILLRPE
ncbi:MAG: glucosaminidase domain-containing protein [Bacteroidales bacterium]|nr:glucosaminidase domain-containing protein [Bacteroidales bacterium]